MHDIQDMPLSDKENTLNEEDDRDFLPVQLPNPLLEDLRRTPPPIQRAVDADDYSINTEQQSRRSNIPLVVVEPPPAPPSSNVPSDTNSNNGTLRRRRRSNDDDDDEDEDSQRNEENGADLNNVGNNAYLDIWAAAISIQHRNLRNTNMGTFNSAHVYGINSGIITSKLARKIPQLPIAQNTPRLMYFKEEPSKGKGFIKELCFSSDGKITASTSHFQQIFTEPLLFPGRIICSPYNQGIRLLSFTPECHELSSIMDPHENCVSRELHQIKISECHPDIVVSTKFSPRYPSVVSGCLSGKIVWHRPQL